MGTYNWPLPVGDPRGWTWDELFLFRHRRWLDEGWPWKGLLVLPSSCTHQDTLARVGEASCPFRCHFPLPHPRCAAKFIHWNIYKKNETQLARNLLSLHIKVWIATILSYFFLYNVVIPNNRILSENIIVNKIDIKAPKFAHLVIKIKIIFLPLF